MWPDAAGSVWVRTSGPAWRRRGLGTGRGQTGAGLQAGGECPELGCGPRPRTSGLSERRCRSAPLPSAPAAAPAMTGSLFKGNFWVSPGGRPSPAPPREPARRRAGGAEGPVCCSEAEPERTPSPPRARQSPSPVPGPPFAAHAPSSAYPHDGCSPSRVELGHHPSSCR